MPELVDSRSERAAAAEPAAAAERAPAEGRALAASRAGAGEALPVAVVAAGRCRPWGAAPWIG